jgi:hypothetical protein
VGRMACTEPQCLYEGGLYLFFLMYVIKETSLLSISKHSYN